MQKARLWRPNAKWVRISNSKSSAEILRRSKSRRSFCKRSSSITAPKKLSKDEIERMVTDAEKFAAQDAKKREEVELINRADNLVYSTEKSLRDYGDKISQKKRADIENAVKT